VQTQPTLFDIVVQPEQVAIYDSGWEVAWTHPLSNGSQVVARNPLARMQSARSWALRATATLRQAGIQTPTYRSDSWEVDWSKRKIEEKLVWARNPASKMPSAREWHWVGQKSLMRAGVKWKHANGSTGRHVCTRGYLVLTKRAMTEQEIEFVDAHGLWRSPKHKRRSVYEHRLVAAKKFSGLPAGTVVRHMNGIKTDNRPENLLLGTSAENTADHNQARLMCMYWHNEVVRLQAIIDATANGKA